jgi:hypothetical protein
VEVKSFLADGTTLVETFGPALVTNGTCKLYETGWTKPATKVQICYDFGWEMALDNVTYLTP